MVASTFDEWYDNAHWGNEDFREGCRRAWEAALAAAWVPCAERMPEDMTQAIVCRPGYESGHSFYFAHRWRGEWLKNDIHCTPIEGVTHWQPLPAAPTE